MNLSKTIIGFWPRSLLFRAVISTLCATFVCVSNAEEIYKWTDDNGKVHFGDRLSAPPDSKAVEIKVQKSNGLPSTVDAKPQKSNGSPPDPNSFKKYPGVKPQPVFIPPPSLDAPTRSVPVDPAKVDARCKGLADEISRVKPGIPWNSLAKNFNETCPGITYECINYRRHPEDNKCGWIERSGNSMVLTRNYE